MLLPRRSGSLGLFLIESALMSVCGITAVYLRFGLRSGNQVLSARRGWGSVLIVTVAVQAGFYLFDLYDSDRKRLRPIVLLGIVQAVGGASMAVAIGWYCAPRLLLGRGTLLITFLLMLIVMVYWRLSLMWVLRHPRFAERILIVGTNVNAITIAREVLNRKDLGYEILGFLGEDPALVGKSLINPRVIGVYDQLEEIVAKYRADRLVVAVNVLSPGLPVEPLMALKLRADVSIEESVSFYERLT